MTRQAKSLFTLAVSLLLATGLRGANSKIFDELHDLSKDSGSVVSDITGFLQELNNNFVTQVNQIHGIMAELPKFTEDLLELEETFRGMDVTDYDKVIGEKFTALFTAARESILSGDKAPVGAFNAAAHKLFVDYAVFYHLFYTKVLQKNIPAAQDMPLLKLILELSKETLKSLQTSQQNVKTTTMTITKEVKASLTIDAQAESRIKDFLEFKKDPVGVLLRNAKSIIAAINEDPEAFGPNGQPAADRVHEFAKAAAIIAKQRSQNPAEPLLDLVKDLAGRAQTGSQMTERPANYKWNVGLLQMLFRELSANGAKPEALEQIHAFLGKNHPANHDSAPLKDAVRQHYGKRAGSADGAIRESDFQTLPGKLHVIDYAIHLYTPEDQVSVISPADKNSIIDHFEPLALVPARPAVFKTFEPALFEKLATELALPEIAPGVYEAVVDFRAKNTDSLAPVEQVKAFDQFLDERFGAAPTDLYVPFKLFLAKGFLNEEDHDIHFADLPAAVLPGTKAGLGSPALGPIRRTAIALFAKHNGKVSPKNIEDEDFVPDLSGKTVNTYHINDLTFEVTSDEPEQVIVIEEPEQPIVIEKQEQPDVIEELEKSLVLEEQEQPDVVEELEKSLVLEEPEQQIIQDQTTEIEGPEVQVLDNGVTEEEIPELIETKIIPEVIEPEIEIAQNKVVEQPIGNVVNVVTGGEYIPEELLDRIKKTDDVEKVLVEYTTVIENDEPVDVVVIRIIRKASPCYDYEMQKLNEQRSQK